MTRLTLNGATVVITGASSGIGRATAHRFAREGANVVLVARRAEALEEVARECCELGVCATTMVADVTDAAAVKKVAAAASKEFNGRIDVWVNDPGIGAVGPFAEVPIDAHDQVIRTNLLGYMHGAHAVLPYFLRQRSGVLVNLNSEGAWIAAPYAVSYTASKFGVRGFAEALRAELRDLPNIHICDVYPGFVDTPAFRHSGNYTGKQLRPASPTLDPYHVADAVVGVAKSPRPTTTVGRSVNVAWAANALFPQVVQWGMKRAADRYLKRAEPEPKSSGSLYRPAGDPATVRGGYRKEKSKASTLALGALALGVGAIVAFSAKAGRL